MIATKSATGGSSTPAGSATARWRTMFVITTTDFGGAEHVLRELAIRIDRREFEPLVCSLCPPGRIGQEIAAAGIPVHTLDMGEQPRSVEVVRGATRLARLLKEQRVQLVHAFLYRANVVSRLASRLLRPRPVILSGHHSLSPLGDARSTLAARWTRGLSDRIVAVSGAVRDQLIRSEHVRPDRVVVIQNGVDTRLYVAPGPDGLRASLGIGGETTVVGAVGRLSSEKGFHHLLAAVSLARSAGLDLHLLLAGAGPEQRNLEAQAADLGLVQSVHFLGVVRDLRPVYAAMDVFALTSREEASPTALMEAMSCGRPVIATRVGGVPEIVEDERSGLMIDAGSASAIAAAIARLAHDAPLCARLAAAARQRVVDHFDVSRMVERHSQLYRSLLTGEA